MACCASSPCHLVQNLDSDTSRRGWCSHWRWLMTSGRGVPNALRNFWGLKMARTECSVASFLLFMFLTMLFVTTARLCSYTCGLPTEEWTWWRRKVQLVCSLSSCSEPNHSICHYRYIYIYIYIYDPEIGDSVEGFYILFKYSNQIKSNEWIFFKVCIATLWNIVSIDTVQY